MQLWDTAGQERLRALSANYFRMADAVVLVFDCTNRESWDNVERWIQQIDKNAWAGVKKALVANKIDLDTNRDVEQEDGKQTAGRFDWMYFETSAKTGEGVEAMFEKIVFELIEDESGKNICEIEAFELSSNICLIKIKQFL